MTLITNAQTRSRLLEIRAKIAALEAELELLHGQECTVRATLDAIVYPVLTIPPDVAMEIFVRYVGSPLVLAGVCRQWREIALSCHRLWPALTYHAPSHGQALLDLLQSRLSRVGNLPFRIDTTLYISSSSGAILPTLVPYFPQILNLTLETTGMIDFPRDRGDLVPLPRLTELSIVRRANSPVLHGRIIIPSTPQLRELRLSLFTWSQIALPWSQLTTLTLGRQSLANGLEILQHTPNLVALHAGLAGVIRSPATFIVLPHLRIIGTASTPLLERITSPALVDLNIEGFNSDGVLAVRDLINRSGCALQKFRLNSFLDGTSLWDAEDCLSAAPSLRDISLSGISCDPEAWGTVFGRIASGTLVPVVESLTLSRIKRGIPIRAISSMLSARAKGVNGVAKIVSFKYFQGEGTLHEGNVDRALSDLRELRAQGMMIEIGWGPKWYRDCTIF